MTTTTRRTDLLLGRIPAPLRFAVADRLDRAVRRLDPTRAYVTRDGGALTIHNHGLPLAKVAVSGGPIRASDVTQERPLLGAPWQPSPSRALLGGFGAWDPGPVRSWPEPPAPDDWADWLPAAPVAAPVADDDDDQDHVPPSAHYDGAHPPTTR